MTTQLIIERLIKGGWHHTADQIDGLLEDASKHNVPYSEFLNTLLLHEIEKREASALQKRIQHAKLPFHKTIYEFDSVKKREFQYVIDSKRSVPK